MSLGPLMGGRFELHNRCEARRCRLPMSPDWGLHSVRACVVVGTRAISRGSARGLALTAEVSVLAGQAQAEIRVATIHLI